MGGLDSKELLLSYLGAESGHSQIDRQNNTAALYQITENYSLFLKN